VYEDDGATTKYVSGAFAYTTCSYTRDSATSMTVEISTEGSYPELPTQRSYTIRLISSLPPQSVSLNGHSLTHAPSLSFSASAPSLVLQTEAQTSSWHYDGLHLALVVVLSPQSLKTPLQVPYIFRLNFCVCVPLYLLAHDWSVLVCGGVLYWIVLSPCLLNTTISIKSLV
jgi:hypothetical protein